MIQEILYRCPPFQSCGDPPKSSKGDLLIDIFLFYWFIKRFLDCFIDLYIETSEIVMRVKNTESPPFRPKLNEDPKIDSRYLDMARDCWSEDKNMRPLTSRLITRFNSFNKGKLARLLGCHREWIIINLVQIKLQAAFVKVIYWLLGSTSWITCWKWWKNTPTTWKK